MANLGPEQSRRAIRNSEIRQSMSSFPPFDSQQFVNGTASSISNNTPVPWNIFNFYRPDAESPWHPPGIAPPIAANSQAGRQRPSLSFDPTTPAFQGHRGKVPSECDTLHEDSGYVGSAPTYSAATPSVYEDDRNEAQGATNLIGSLHLGTPSLPHERSSSWSQPRPAASATTAPATGDNKFYCSSCDKWLSTRSELNKHKARHQKPFTCDIVNCRRNGGFSTKNDLDRHKRSLHPELFTDGDRYVCRLGSCAFKEKLKVWPRADNFRSHLERMHRRKLLPEQDLEEFLYHPQTQGQDLQGVGTAITIPTSAHPLTMPRFPDNLYAQNLQGNQDLYDSASDTITLRAGASTLRNQHMFATPQEDERAYIKPTILVEPPETPISYTRTTECDASPTQSLQHYDAVSSHETPCSPADHSSNNSAEDVLTSSDQDNTFCSRISNLPYPDLDDQSEDSGDAETLDVPQDPSLSTRSSPEPSPGFPPQVGQDSQDLLHFLKTLPKQMLETALGSSVTLDESPSQEATNKGHLPCKECGKKFSRPCELKKHLKRHEKPYGCTFPRCGKQFGSKNDWKRHESSQHFQLESWKCEDLKSNQDPCNKVCHRREAFRHHLQKDHMFEDQNEIDEKLDRCRIGRHCEARFWCGFCERLVETQGGANAWTWRCDHIDDHFVGRHGMPKVSIRKWKHLDDPEDNQAATSPGLGPGASPNGATSGREFAGKRKRENERDAQSLKRTRVQEPLDNVYYMWNCCRCNAFMNLKTSPSCMECGHARCDTLCTFDETNGWDAG